MLAENSMVSIIVPVFNEAAGIKAFLQSLRAICDDDAEVIVVDGGSLDGTPELVAASGVRLISAARGRAAQLAAGVRGAQGDLYWFLHADSDLSQDSLAEIRRVFALGYCWGRFDVRLSGSRPIFAVISAAINMRSRWSGIATGDQGIFVTGEALRQIGGVPQQELMEDIEMSRLLKRQGRPACLRLRLGTSSRRWQKNGIFRTICLMWWLRLRYFLGGSPAALERVYHGRGRLR